MFSKDTECERLKEILIGAGADKGEFRQWRRLYDKVSKSVIQVWEKYERARVDTKRVNDLALRLEKMIQGGEDGSKDFLLWFKELKRLTNSFDHEFLISKEDREFHSTYDSIVKIGLKYQGGERERLILQSEIENLLALLKENLDKQIPDKWELGYYTYAHGKESLDQLPYTEKLERLHSIYELEFMQPVMRLIANRSCEQEARKLVEQMLT